MFLIFSLHFLLEIILALVDIPLVPLDIDTFDRKLTMSHRRSGRCAEVDILYLCLERNAVTPAHRQSLLLHGPYILLHTYVYIHTHVKSHCHKKYCVSKTEFIHSPQFFTCLHAKLAAQWQFIK
jgi:hypothetical protein